MIEVDMREEKFGAAVSIAHLAANSFPGWDSRTGTIYQADEILTRDWKWELEGDIEMEYALGVIATFKDGSRLRVAAEGSCCDGPSSGCRHCGQ